MNKDLLLKHIYSAFEHNEYPGDDQLIHEKDRHDLEAQWVKEKLMGTDWQNVTHEAFYSGGFYHLTSKAYHYFFPSLLIAMIRDGNEHAEMHLMYVLSPSKKNVLASGKTIFELRFQMFNDAQRKVIGEFVNWYFTMWPQRGRNIPENKQQRSQTYWYWLQYID